MGVPPLGPESSNLSVLLRQLALQPPGTTGTVAGGAAAISEDQIAALLQALATPAVAELLSNIEQRVLPEHPALVQQLLLDASFAISSGDLPAALVKVKELVTLSPRQAETVAGQPLLEPIQSDVMTLVRQITAQVRFQAQENVAAAADAIAKPAPRAPLQDTQPDLRTILTLATRFVESGRVADNLIASELARIVIAQLTPNASPGSAALVPNDPKPAPPGSTPPVPNDPKATPPAPLLSRQEMNSLIAAIEDRLTLPNGASATGFLVDLTNEAKAGARVPVLARPEIQELIATIEERLLPPDPAVPKELVREAGSALAEGDVPRALAKVKELLLADPRQAETMAAEPSLQPIQREILNVIRQMVSQARAQAQQVMTAAQQASGLGGAKKLASPEVEVRILFPLANHFIDSGRLIDFRIAIELAQIGLGRSARTSKIRRIMRTPKPLPSERREPLRERFQRAWLRVPLLILLLAWFALGLAFGIGSLLLRKLWPERFDPGIASLGFGIWAIGFLALVGFGFYMRVRNVRFDR